MIENAVITPDEVSEKMRPTEQENKGLLYGSLIAAGIHAAAGGLKGGIGDAAIQGLAGGFSSYKGGMDELSNMKKQSEIWDMQRQKEEALGKHREVLNALNQQKADSQNMQYYDNLQRLWEKQNADYEAKMAALAAREKAQKVDSGDKALVAGTIQQMPKLKKAAMQGYTALDKIDTLHGLISSGNVTGKGGQLRALLAPYAEAVGIYSENMNDAQTFQLLSRAMVGPMRLDIVGGGETSNYEQKLMNAVSGGGGSNKQAAMELLNYWGSLANDKVDNYEQTLEGLSTIYPNIKRVYQPMPTRKQGQPKETQGQSGGLKGTSTEDLLKQLGVK